MDGGQFPIGSRVDFSIMGHSGLLDPITSVDVFWEVSNGGINEDHEAQEIYYKGEKEKEDKLEFSRNVVYDGRHLLRCRVKNKNKKFDVTKIFVVNGFHDS